MGHSGQSPSKGMSPPSAERDPLERLGDAFQTTSWRGCRSRCLQNPSLRTGSGDSGRAP